MYEQVVVDDYVAGCRKMHRCRRQPSFRRPRPARSRLWFVFGSLELSSGVETTGNISANPHACLHSVKRRFRGKSATRRRRHGRSQPPQDPNLWENKEKELQELLAIVGDSLRFSPPLYPNSILGYNPVDWLPPHPPTSEYLVTMFHRPLTIIQNATDSIGVDLFEAVLGKAWDVHTEPAAKACPFIHRAIHDPEKKRVVVLCHSPNEYVLEDGRGDAGAPERPRLYGYFDGQVPEPY